MTKAEHIERHETLNKALNELVCDMLMHTNMIPHENTILDLMTWSLNQTADPDEQKTE